MEPCPLCRKIPESAVHIILDCHFTKTMWRKIEPILVRIIPIPPSTYEMAMGIQPRTKHETNASTLRNWITFSLQEQIMKEERRAYYQTRSLVHTQAFIARFNQDMKNELNIKHLQYVFRGLETKFDAISTLNEAIGKQDGKKYIWKDIL